MGIEVPRRPVCQRAHLNMQFLLLPASSLGLLPRASSHRIRRRRWEFRVCLSLLQGF